MKRLAVSGGVPGAEILGLDAPCAFNKVADYAHETRTRLDMIAASSIVICIVIGQSPTFIGYCSRWSRSCGPGHGAVYEASKRSSTDP